MFDDASGHSPARIDRIDPIILRIHIRVGLERLRKAATNRGVLQSAARRRIIIANTELSEARKTIEIAFDEASGFLLHQYRIHYIDGVAIGLIRNAHFGLTVMTKTKPVRTIINTIIMTIHANGEET